MFSNNITRNAVLLMLLPLFIATAARAQLDLGGTNAYIKNDFIQAGLNVYGCYGSSYDSALPAGYYFPNNTNSNGMLGFICSPQNTWPNFYGDFMLPGTPYEGFSVSYTNATTSQPKRVVNRKDSGSDMLPRTTPAFTYNKPDYSDVTWHGIYAGAFEIDCRFRLDGARIIHTTTIKNISADNYTDVYFVRGMDPDQENGDGGGITLPPEVICSWRPDTKNFIQAQADGTEGSYSWVTANGTCAQSSISLYSSDPNSRVGISVSWYAFLNNPVLAWGPSSANVYYTQVDEFSRTEAHDWAIELAIFIGDINAGESKTVEHEIRLDQPPVVSFSTVGLTALSGDFYLTKREGETFTFTVIRQYQLEETVTVEVMLSSVTGVSAADFVGVDALPKVYTLVFGPNETEKTITIEAAHDMITEDDEQFQLEITSITSLLGGLATLPNKVYGIITDVTYPDNIIYEEGECVVPFEEIVFDVKHKWNSPTGTAHCNTGPLVGDLDGDGIPEIITFASNGTILYVLDGSNGTVKTSLTIPSAYGYGGWYPVMTAVMVDSDGNGKGEIVLATNDNKLTSYEAQGSGGTMTLVKKWESTFVTPTNNGAGAANPDNKPQPIVTDFNGDGIPEIVVFNQIHNARTGAIIGYTETSVNTAYLGRIANRGGNNASNFMAVGDFDGDGLPELAAGGKIYKVNVNASSTSATCSIMYQTSAFADGFTAVADVDLDGKLDVVVVDFTGSVTRLNVWSPTTNTVIDQILIPNSDLYQGYPFIGDIDGVEVGGKKYPEICVTTRRTTPTPTVGRVSAYKYVPGTKKYTLKWELINTDTSGGTGITLFDFNNDGINELVYRDEQFLYILNGVADNTAPTIASVNSKIKCTSGTAFEYPVIADLDGSGTAQICVTCSVNAGGVSQTLNAFESGTTPWAPTRKVWNQVNYDPVTINEDLTVPKKLFAKQTVFEADGKEYRPYNGALIQVPIMNLDMEPVVRAADPYIISVAMEQISADMARVKVTIGNLGQVNVNASLPVAIYANSIASANIIGSKPIGETLIPGNTVVVTFDVQFSDLPTTVIARLQDDNGAYPASGYSDCNMDNNTTTYAVLLAVNDYVSPEKNKDITFNAMVNDYLGSCTISTITIKLDTDNEPVHGTAVMDGKNIKYTPDTDYIGTDSFKYKIICGTEESTGTVTVIVNSTVMVEKLNNIDASEPNIVGKFRIKFTDATFTLGKDIEVAYSIIPTVAIAGTDYVAPSGTATITAGQSYVDVTIAPIDNFLVQSNNREVKLTIIGVVVKP